MVKRDPGTAGRAPAEVDRDEGFLTRWSRRKRGEAGDGAVRATTDADLVETAALDEAEDDGPAHGLPRERVDSGKAQAASNDDEQAIDDRFKDVDFDALDYKSDYTQFMGRDVSDKVRNKALAKLWTSDPILANLDGLNDYCEDYTDAAMAVPMGMLKTAYKVGQGFLTDEEAAEWDRLGKPGTEDGEVPVAAAAEPNALMAVVINQELPTQADIRELFAASDAFSADLYPADSNHSISPVQLIAAGAVFLVARDPQGLAVGCGAVICQLDRTAEIKRMWVAPDARRGGIGAKILEGLTAAARERQVAVVRLETGVKQPAAVALYERAGFVTCAPFGAYVEDPNSLYMHLDLSAATAADDAKELADGGNNDAAVGA